MHYFVPKIMIYRIGKYAPNKPFNQEIEMMLKFTNNDDSQKAKISFAAINKKSIL